MIQQLPDISIDTKNDIRDTASSKPAHRVMIFCDHFYPAWKLGGTIQSLMNLVQSTANVISYKVVTSAYDLNEPEPMKDIDLTGWNQVGSARVRYLQKADINYAQVQNIFDSEQVDAYYINGLYSIPFAIYPLWLWKKKSRNAKMIIAPRGMLQEGALKNKQVKKKVFLFLFKMLGLHDNVTWHATDQQELLDVKSIFGEKADVSMVADTPKPPPPAPVPIIKTKGDLKLIYLSLIAEKKNLALAIKMLGRLNFPVTYHIYGPIKDVAYWNQCQKLIARLPAHIKVKYMGEVLPGKVQEVFSTYHMFFFPTKGENFGHVIYECFSVGRPVLISDKTPWRNLDNLDAGYDISITDETRMLEVLQNIYDLDQQQFDVMVNGAYNVANTYWKQNDPSLAYAKLFN